MESHRGGIYAGEACGCEMSFESFIVPEIVALSEEKSSVLEADLGKQRRFELACGEVNYFQPDVVNPKRSTQALENTVRSESVSPKCYNCAESYEKMKEKWSWPEEHDSGQAQNTVRSVNSFQSTTDQLRVISVQNLRSSAPVTTMVDSLYLEDGRNICTQDFAISLNDLSLFEMGKQSKKGDVSDYLLASSDSNDPNTPADDFQRSLLVSFTKESIPREGFSDDLKLKAEEEGSKLLQEDASSKQNLQHILKGESCTNSRLPKSQDVSSGQLGILADDERDLACDVEERRNSLISAATCASDLPRFKWDALEMEDLESMQAESKTNVTIDSTCTAPCMDLLKDLQEVESPDLDEEFRVFDSSHGEREQGVIFSTGQQTDCPGSVVLQSDVREAVVVAVQILTEENRTKNGEENLLELPSEATLAVGIAEAFYEAKTTSDLALLTMGELELCLPPAVANLHSAEAKNAEVARKPIVSLNRKTPELITRSAAFSFENQLQELCNLGLGGPMKAASEDNASVKVLESQIPGSDGGVSIVESFKGNNCALKEELEESSSINMAFVPVTLEGSCEDYEPDNNSEAKVGSGQEKIRQHLWCYLFENMNRAINELYSLCDLESDAEKIKEALLVLDGAASAKVTNSFLSTKKDLQQRRPHSTAWEVRRMACSQEQAGMPTSSLEDFKRENGSSQSDSLQGPRNHADARQPDAFESLPFQGPACVATTASPGQEGCPEKESTISDSELLTGRSFDLACKKSAPSSSLVDRYMSLTAFSEHRACSKKRQISAPTGSVTGIEAWKEKRNCQHTLSPLGTRSSRASRSPRPDRKSMERVRVLHDKLASPKRRKGSPKETKDVDGEQACAHCIHMALENEEVQRLSKTQEKLSTASEWQASRSQYLRGSMHSQQERGDSRAQAGVAQIARRARNKSSKFSEFRLIASSNEEKEKLDLLEELHGSESQGAERLHSSRLKRKEDIAKEEDVEERRRQLDAERSQLLTEVQRKKEGVKTTQEEEIKISGATLEARATYQIRKKEAWVISQQEEAEFLEQKLSDRLLKSSLRRKIYLEKIKESALMDFEKQDKLSKDILSEPIRMRDQSLSFGRLVSRRQKDPPNETLNNEAQKDGPMGGRHEGVALVSLVGNHEGTWVQTTKNKSKLIRQRLTSRKIEYCEPPVGIEGRGHGTATVIGGARSKIRKWMQELKRLQEIKKPGRLTTSRLVISEIEKYLEEREPMLHAARHQGLIDHIATALPASHSSRHEPSAFTVALLRLLMVVLFLPANRSYFIARNLLPPLIPMLSMALRTFSSSDSVNNRGVLSQKISVVSKERSALPSEGQGTVMLVKEEKMTQAEKLKTMQEVLEGLLSVTSSIIGHTCIDDHLFQMQEDLAELVVACEVLRNLQTLFALYDGLQMEGPAIPGPIILGLRLLEALTGPRGKMLSAAHEAPVNIVGRPLQPTPELASIQENLGSQKLVDVKKACSNGSSVEIRASEAPDDMTRKLETKASNKNSRPDLSAVVQLEFQIDGKNKQTMSSSSKLLLKEIEETGLVGLPSLLTAIFLQANQRVTTDQVASVLQSNFEEVAISVLRVINNAARLNLSLVQNMLAFSDVRMEFFYLINFLLSHCTYKWKSSSDQIGALLMETLLLLGYAALLHPGNQVVLRWGKSPTILNKICDLPFGFFSDPKLTPILIGTLLSVCFGNERNRDIVQQELSTEMLLAFLKNSTPDPAPAPRASIPKSEGDGVSVELKPKPVVFDLGSFTNTARDGSLLKHPSDKFFPSLKKPIRLSAKSSLNLSMTLVSSDGGSLPKDFSSATSTFRSMSDRDAPASQLQHVSKRAKGVKSSYPSLYTKPTYLTVTQTIPSAVTSRTRETKVVSSPPPALLSLQNRFPVVLWPHAKEFFSTSASMGRTLESL